LPTSANAARTKSCDGIGDTARTLAAKWVETAATGGGRFVRIDGFRCARSNPPGPGRAVRCAKSNGAVVVSFRYRLP
jgi:hypothetical protein